MPYRLGTQGQSIEVRLRLSRQLLWEAPEGQLSLEHVGIKIYGAGIERHKLLDDDTKDTRIL